MEWLIIIRRRDADRIVAKFSRSRPPFFSFFFPSYATISNAAQHSRLNCLTSVNLKIHENSMIYNNQSFAMINCLCDFTIVKKIHGIPCNYFLNKRSLMVLHDFTDN